MAVEITAPGTGTAVDYGVLLPVTVHFDDLDPFGMLHNTRYALLVERAWISWAWEQGFGVKDGTPVARGEGDAFNAVKAFSIEFDRPVMNPGPLAVHLWTDRIGRTSVTNGFRLCDSSGTTTYAHGTRTVVALDPRTMRPAEISERAASAWGQIERSQPAPVSS